MAEDFLHDYRKAWSFMIDLDHVSKQYEKGLAAVDELSLHVDKGEFVFVVGDSGSGKSTMIRLLLKELEPTSGIITVNGL